MLRTNVEMNIGGGGGTRKLEKKLKNTFLVEGTVNGIFH